MGFIHSQEPRVLIVLFAVLCFGEYKVEGNSILQLVTIGDDFKLTCRIPNQHGVNYNSWKKNGILLSNRFGVSRDYPRITHSYTNYPNLNYAYYDLTIDNARIIDSDTYSCFDYKNDLIYSYDLRVMGCSNCALANHSNPDKRKVVCNLDNYWTRDRTDISIYVGSMASPKPAVIKGKTFSFAISKTLDVNIQTFTFDPYTQTYPAYGTITCQLPTQIPSTQPSTNYLTTPSISTPDQREFTSSYRTASQDATSGAPNYVTEHHKLKNKDSNKGNNSNQGKNLSDSDITMIIVISGSIFIIILIVLIVILRWKQKKNHQENKHNGILSVDGKDTKEHPEACYESVNDASQRGLRKSTSNEKMKDKSENQPNDGGMVENILYDSSDKIADGSISRTEGPLDNALYAMPDKRKTLDRESKSGAVGGSCNADILYDNSSIIISQQEQKRDTLHRGDQYENVEMRGSGVGAGAEEIPLYEMPDKAPQRNTLNAIPKAKQNSTVPIEEVVNVDALYAEVDKTKKK